MGTILFTGFPGFLGSELLPRILRRFPDDRAICLVQPKFADLARRRLEALTRADPSTAERVDLREGDITEPHLGWADAPAVPRDCVEIFHLAAVYDLSVPKDLAHRVNVLGTRHMLRFAGACPRLRRFQYVSTCYVSGHYAGVFTEEDLDKGQRFNNFYEETKFRAEVEVQESGASGLPVTIYRPAIVVGDSRTGATQKYDGPYFLIRWVLRLPWIAFLPVVGDPTATRVNVVPRDFVVDAIATLAPIERSCGRVYQLADPEPLTADEMIVAIARATRRRIVRIPVTLGVARAAIDDLPLVYRIMQIPSSALDYFVHPTHYTCDHTTSDLAGTGVRVPPFRSYVGHLVSFVRKHPEIGSEAMA